MIPVVVTSIMNRPDLLDRLVASFDVPLERGLIVDNGRTGYQADLPWVSVQPPFRSLGWPGTLNFGIMQTPDAPWWLLVNNDAYFEPGKLAALAERMDSDEPQILHHSWTATAINRAVIETVGLFDEWSFWPLYFDDTDYAYRCHLAGVPVEHGDWCREGDDGETASMTIRSDPEFAAANNRTWALNRTAYIAKWGGPPGREQFTRPWDRDVPLWATKPDPWGRQARSW